MNNVSDWITDYFIPTIFLPVAMGFVGLVMIIGIILTPVSIYASNSCLDYGYPKYYVTWNFQTKCSRIVNQTEYVCSLEDIKSNECSHQK